MRDVKFTHEELALIDDIINECNMAAARLADIDFKGLTVFNTEYTRGEYSLAKRMLNYVCSLYNLDVHPYKYDVAALEIPEGRLPGGRDGASDLNNFVIIPDKTDEVEEY